jgi:hypothetical protein
MNINTETERTIEPASSTYTVEEYTTEMYHNTMISANEHQH